VNSKFTGRNTEEIYLTSIYTLRIETVNSERRRLMQSTIRATD